MDIMAMLEKKDNARYLTLRLARSLKIRETFNLPATGTVKTQFIKPSGYTMADTANHKVVILLNDKIRKTISLPEFEELMK